MSLTTFFQSGDIAVLIILMMLAEVVVLAVCFKSTPGLFAGIAAGACLVLALRAALLQQPWTIMASFLSLSFVFHVMEIVQWLRLAKRQPQ